MTTYKYATATYSEVDGKMVQDGYFLYADGGAKALAWVSLKDIKEV